MAVRERCDSGVARRGVQLVEAAAAGERPRNRVLATPRADNEHSHRRIVSVAGEAGNAWAALRFDSGGGAQDWGMHEPGLERHDWESEWQALGDDLRADPAGAMPELDGLVARMLEESGYDLTDPVVREGDEREVVAQYLAAHEVVEAAERGSEELSPGDVAAAINGLRAVYAHLVTTRSTADAELGAPEAEEA
jgi:hypothetical protein